MERVFTELSPRRDEIAQLYGLGLERKEIASKIFRSETTVNTTIQRVFELLHVRNRSELSIKFAERISGYDFKRGIIAMCLLFLFVFDLSHNNSPLTRAKKRIEERENREEEAKDLYNPFEV